jgi:hypothetical protein
MTPTLGACAFRGSTLEGDDPVVLNVKDSWHMGKTINANNHNDLSQVYKVDVIGTDKWNSYTIVADSKSTPLELQASHPYHDSVKKGKWVFYKLVVDDADTTLGIRLTTYSGEADIYVREGRQPNLDDYQWVS